MRHRDIKRIPHTSKLIRNNLSLMNRQGSDIPSLRKIEYVQCLQSHTSTYHVYKS